MNSPHGHRAEEQHPGDGAACGMRWASERRRQNHARVEVPETLAMVDGQPGKWRRRPTIFRARERYVGREKGANPRRRRPAPGAAPDRASPGSVASWRLGSGDPVLFSFFSCGPRVEYWKLQGVFGKHPERSIFSTNERFAG
jgi:hypothetical protein